MTLIRRQAIALAALMLSLQVQSATLFESEPNNSANDAETVVAPVLIKGQLDGADQDAFIWDVSDTDAQQTWVLSLEGAMGHLQSLTLFDLTDPQLPVELVRFDKSPDRLQLYPSPLLLAPGKYMVGMAGHGDYLLNIGAHSEVIAKAGFPGQVSLNAERNLFLATDVDEKAPLSGVSGNLTSVSLRSYPGSDCALVLYDDAEQVVQRSYCNSVGFAKLDRLSLDH